MAAPTPRTTASLTDALQAVIGRHPGTIGVVVTSLSSPQSFVVNADRRFRAASLYKLFVLYTAEAALEDGGLNPSDTLTVTRAVAASDPYTDLQVGTRIDVGCALRTMVEMSGNTAADLLVDRLGLSRVTANIVPHQMEYFWQAPAPRYTSGVFAKYTAMVGSASHGAITTPRQ